MSRPEAALAIDASRSKGGIGDGRGNDSRRARVHTTFIALLDIQLALGLALYVLLSPIASQAITDIGAAMRDPQLRFFGVEHIVTPGAVRKGFNP